ncbi:MAG: phage integrase N-terminal SAM-like domain-containing protein [Thermodesulfobacteriota bacterium]|nr:phage integrase N-terminal SAM-like domain-containing protein [Thermodesulfobacteriota bacterium]
MDAYSRAVRRVSEPFDCCPDKLTPKQLETCFGELVDTHSWSTVKIDRNGLQFFWRYALKRDWQWVNIIKPPKRSVQYRTFLPLSKQSNSLGQYGNYAIVFFY